MPVSLEILLGAAPYLHQLRGRHADWLDAAMPSPDAALATELAAVAAAGGATDDDSEIGRALRLAKGRIALLAAAAETGGLWTTAQGTAVLSDLADAALHAGLDFLLRKAIAKGDIKPGITPANSGLAIFALGKHGGRELNYSSDIDIVAFFDRSRDALTDPDDATKILSRVVQRLAALMQDRIGDDYVFRTDLRLRPDPGSTPVAISIEAALAYYESRGQNWERAAWIKARPCAGDVEIGDGFIAELAPYIWRRHLDFATIADIQAMKRQINISKNVGDARVEGHNVKLGRGGIREIEFFAQTQQLIAGGRDKSLRVRPTAEALAALARTGWIAPTTATELTETYWFLRAVENRLQMLRDEQTHIMPETEEGVAVIAALMGQSPDDFRTAYRDALNRVQGYYADLFTQGETLGAAGGNLVFTGSDDDPATIETLTKMGFHDAAAVSAIVRKWHYGSYSATRASAARAHLTELLPLLLTTFAHTGNADLAFHRFDNFLSRIPTGVQLFALLRNHGQLRDLLVQLMASAPRMAEAVVHRAHVMDALIDPAFADDVSRRSILVAKVDAFLGDARDYQEVIERARIIGQEQQFLIAAGLLSGTVSAQRAGSQFTALAETLLRKLFAAVRTEFEKRHGTIPGASVALLGFGKMASREMTHSSDLDFILLYDAADATTESDGERPLAATQYFARLTQRLVAAVTAPTAEGVLYHADMRLRPSGNAGPLATSLRAFIVYQEESAWTWEHLALTRARIIEADSDFGQRIEGIIGEILDRPRDAEQIITDVLTMRELMAKERPARHPFDLKLVPGGLVDLEFIAQSAQLLARSQIALPHGSAADVLKRLGELGLVPDGARLAEIHGVYSAVLQVMSAALADPFKDEGWTDAFRDLLAQLTNEPNFQRLREDLAEMQAEVRSATPLWYERAKRL
ncbi:MAG: bifunctional [glutamine synthetase] adenylyltransferase/[glutamine synthetase]-adenylyl-L-tyrosine phosphorylase [Devosia sp.]